MEWRDEKVENGLRSMCDKHGQPVYRHKFHEHQVAVAYWNPGVRFAVVFAHGKRARSGEFQAGLVNWAGLASLLSSCPKWDTIEVVFLCVCKGATQDFARCFSGHARLRDKQVLASTQIVGVPKVDNARITKGTMRACVRVGEDKARARPHDLIDQDWILAQNGAIL